MKKLLIPILALSLLSTGSAAEPAPLILWPAGTAGVDPTEKETPSMKEARTLKDIRNPRLIPFLPEKPNGTAIIICPGGGYTAQATQHEGAAVAQFLNKHNISAYVLRYRLPKTKDAGYHHPVPVSDALRALQTLRANAAETGIKKIGILGFSAGGHLAASAATLYGDTPVIKESGDAISKVSARPDFACLGYPVITADPKYAHGCIYSLLPKPPQDPLFNTLSCEKNVTAETPPTFLFHAKDDKAVVPENSILFHEALKEKGVSTQLFLHETGGHGYGLGRPNTDAAQWADTFIQWLKSEGLIPKE